MIKILDQSNKQLFELEGNNIFVNKNNIVINSHVNKFSGDTALLGEYNNEQEAMDEFEMFQEWLEDIDNTDKLVYIYAFKEKKEEQKDERE